MKFYTIIFYMFLLLIQSSCKKDALPPETATGANTFGCKVNGKVYTISGGDGWSVWPLDGGRYQDVDGNVGLSVRTISKNTEFIDLYIKKLNGPGIYNLNYNIDLRSIRSESYGYYGFKDNLGNYTDFVTTTQYRGWINLKVATNNIYAGTFEFTAYNSQTGETVVITDGRFDIKNH